MRSVCMLNGIRLFVTPWIVAQHTLLSIEVSRQEYWRGLPFPPPGDLPNPGMETESAALVDRFFTTEPPGKPKWIYFLKFYSVICRTVPYDLKQFYVIQRMWWCYYHIMLSHYHNITEVTDYIILLRVKDHLKKL